MINLVVISAGAFFTDMLRFRTEPGEWDPTNLKRAFYNQAIVQLLLWARLPGDLLIAGTGWTVRLREVLRVRFAGWRAVRSLRRVRVGVGAERRVTRHAVVRLEA